MSADGLTVAIQGMIGTLTIDVTFQTAGSPVAILGPNGCGKTTILRMILGVRTPRQGRVTLKDTVLLDSDQGIDIPVERRCIGYV
ncbi:MAG: ATP-binding cassette domain-containing protein, partial [Deltaproteobacteria bacterium]|nr:ATP-binding cassette domain-containing protein [Deltaproteobacteria bacterium]